MAGNYIDGNFNKIHHQLWNWTFQNDFVVYSKNILLCMYILKETSCLFSKIVSFLLFVYGETALTLHCKSHSINSLIPVGGLINCVQRHSCSKLEYGHCYDRFLELTIHSWNFPISTKNVLWTVNYEQILCFLWRRSEEYVYYIAGSVNRYNGKILFVSFCGY